MNPFTWSKAQWDAFGRHVLTITGTAVPLLVVFKVISPEQGDSVITHTGTLIAAIAGLFLALAPIYAAFRAAYSASPGNQVDQAVKNLKEGVVANGKKDQLIEAVAELPEVRKVVVMDRSKANEIPSDKVTSA